MAFDPLKNLSPFVREVDNALIIPFGTESAGGIARYAGIYDEHGTYVPEGQCFRTSTTPTTLEPKEIPAEPEERLNGTWIWGGLLYSHFGHMLLESTGRLWAHDHVEAEGELFLLKKKVTWPKRFVKPINPILSHLGAKTAKAKGVTRPLRVEKLVIAPQGFGTGDMIAGCPEMRAFVKSNWGKGIEPAGHEKIYISRSRLYSKRGRYIGESFLEALLEKEGYAIFHAQDHSIEEQIAQYKAAKVVISSDSSALHLHACFSAADTKVAIILRRPGEAINDYLTQYRSFSGIAPLVISSLNGAVYQFDGARNSQKSEIYTEIDFPSVARELYSANYIEYRSAWQNPPADEIKSEVASISERLGAPIYTVSDDI
ncbi:glycosyltransferase family 61 protein [Falsirhodobacter xinxiangensis]|uniref:glycosyltransferase family 61 protein n=1 Tax=Falsirhodobacter xinxiangensis TaxID=2530049 RepID=UPI00145A7774|nr:glycosyltransferase family 61 protein [Rhodobacter xinxiangensis]